MSETNSTLLLDGPLTIKTIANVKDVVLASLNEAATGNKLLTIDINSQDVDLTLPQLILSARRTAEEMGLKISLKKPAEGNFLSVLQRAGLLSGDNKEDSFWLEGEAA